MRKISALLFIAVFIIICRHIKFASSFTSSPNCHSNGQFGNRSTFSFNRHYYSGDIQYITGRPEVCTSVGSTPVCRDSLTQIFMENFCQYIHQYNSKPVDSILIGSLSDYIDGYTTQYAVTNVTCLPSSNSSSINNCNYQINQTNCSDYGGVAVFSCRAGLYECSDDWIELRWDTLRLNTGSYTGSRSNAGRLTACLNNEYIDICADNVTLYIGPEICGAYGNGYTYSFQPWSSVYGTSSSRMILTNLNCSDNNLRLNECSYSESSIDECHSGPLVIGCSRECSSGVRVVNQKVSYLPDGTYLTGHLETCVDYRWVSVCDNGSLPTVLAEISCRYVNSEFTNGTFIYSNDTGGNEINGTFYTGFSCSDNAYFFSHCVPSGGLTQTNSSQCSHATIQCYRSNECSFSNLQLSSTTWHNVYYPFIFFHYFRATSGRPELCINNKRAILCNNTVNTPNSNVIDYVCNGAGAPYPVFDSPGNYGVNLVNNNFITSIKCPMDGSGLDDCNIITGDTCDIPVGAITCLYADCSKYTAAFIFLGYSGAFTIGYAGVCDGISYIPICANGITDEELHYICVLNGYYGYTVGSMVQFIDEFKVNFMDMVATNVSCPVFSRNDKCRYSTGNTCDDRGGIALVVCIYAPHTCNHGDVRITGGPNSYTGRPEFCYFGTWRTICGTEYYQADAAVTCQMAEFNHDGAVNVTGGMYGGNGMSPVLAGLRCVTGREGYFSNCNPINGDLLSTCDPSMAAAVHCEPLIVSMTTRVSVDNITPSGIPTNANITCNANFDQISLDNYTLNSIDWYHNGQLITNTSSRHNLTMSFLTEYSCSHTCGFVNVGVRLVLRLEMVQSSDAGEYTCVVNITDIDYGRTVVNMTTEAFVLKAVCSPKCLNGNCTSYNKCTCNSGWTGDICNIDINECDDDNGGCDQTCTNTNGSYYCSCNNGYNISYDGLGCDKPSTETTEQNTHVTIGLIAAGLTIGGISICIITIANLVCCIAFKKMYPSRRDEYDIGEKLKSMSEVKNGDPVTVETKDIDKKV